MPGIENKPEAVARFCVISEEEEGADVGRYYSNHFAGLGTVLLILCSSDH